MVNLDKILGHCQKRLRSTDLEEGLLESFLLCLYVYMSGILDVVGISAKLSLFRQNTYLQNKKHTLTCQRWDWLLQI